MDSFYTVAESYEWEQIIEKSRFIGLVCPAGNMADVDQALKKTREDFPNARHYVYAYRLLEGKREKSSDDGEPQGTGGRPVMDVLQGKELWNVLVVVVRYFGGILLGTGGLTRAYGGTARFLLNEAPVQKLTAKAAFTLHIPYPLFEPLKYQLELHHWGTGQTTFSEAVHLKVYIPQREKEAFLQWLQETYHGQIDWQLGDALWQV
ncbi:MAG: IMPACT family protein [Peptococcaceae bacterium]|jgi:uncharacterized YigZ family protein|nr:IMPACT family protein [Peptococcaceae bacterium]